MSIEEEIKILENALSGALILPSECAFVSTEIIKICLDTLKTYESWENLIRYEIEKQIRSDAIDEFADKLNAKCSGMIKDKWNSNTAPISWAEAYADFKDDIEQIAEELKAGGKNE